MSFNHQDLHANTLTELSSLLQSKAISSVELTEYLLKRIKNLDPQLNCFITVTEEQALKAALEADQKRAAGDDRPLLGIPIAHKDIFCIDGTKTSCGSKMLENFIAPYDSTVTQRLSNAGFISIGKTNLDEFAMGSSTETSFFGATRNPWDTKRVPGGSSGGSAAAVAAGLTPVATGTDTGGSIRQPAAFCGISGIKPTYGRVSRWGMVAFASSLDQAGMFGRCSHDLALTLNAIAGHDDKDSTCSSKSVPDYVAALTTAAQNDGLKNMTIGLPSAFFNETLCPTQATLLQNAIDVLKTRGIKFKTIHLPHLDSSVSTYYVIAPAECSSNLSRFDGVRFGHRCEAPTSLQDLYARTRQEGFGDEVKRRILVGTYVLSAEYFETYYRKAQKVRRLISQDFKQAFTEVDAILAPTTPGPAFKIETKNANPLNMYKADHYTIAVNLAGLPAMSIPIGFDNGLPIGMQLIGDHFEESRLLQIANSYEQMTDWHQHRPAL